MNRIKKIIAPLLVLALLVAALPAADASAATKTQKDVLAAGETMTYYSILGSVKSVKSTNKKVATAKKKNGKVVVKAKKKGKANIKIKTTFGTNIIKLTVKKKIKLAASIFALSNGNIGVKIKNKSGFYLDTVNYTLSLKTSSGSVIETKKGYVYYLGAKKTGYDTISYYESSNSVNHVDLSKCSIKYDSVNRGTALSYKFAKADKKVKFTNRKNSSKIAITAKSTVKDSVYAGASVLFYDSMGNLIDVKDTTFYLSSKSTSTYEVSVPYNGYKSYKVVTRAYIKKIK
ncbi:MAG: hypothetical protein K6D02_08045 [Lachnospiraceae bacterium]|nr:hypothetical protein [Lachnospiraceae bacterium]